MMTVSPFAGAPPLPVGSAAGSFFGLIPSIPVRRNSRYRQLEGTIKKNRSSQMFLVYANADAPRGKKSSSKVVLMVDPIEAKRLAAKQMQEIQAKEKLQRRRQAEAVNGALAMFGLTAALVAEGQTGKGILGQLAAYWTAFSSLFSRYHE